MLAAKRALSLEKQREDEEKKKAIVAQWRDIDNKIKIKKALSRREEKTHVTAFLQKIYGSGNVEASIRKSLQESLSLSNSELIQRKQKREEEKARWT